MPASLLSLKIRGLRSYSPQEVKTQTIDFMPLTLIVGSNGSGKTTILECLKYIISGDEPPLSDGRRNFLNSSQDLTKCSRKGPVAVIELEFLNSKGQLCYAKREFSSGIKTGPPPVASCFKVHGQSWIHVNRKEDWIRTVPALFSLPNEALLNNVILCHQENNLWCLGVSSEVKQVFDKIFGCEQYKLELKHIEAEIKTCKSELASNEREVVYSAEKVKRKKSLSVELNNNKDELEQVSKEIKALDKQIETVLEEKESVANEIANQEQELREQEKKMLQDKLENHELEDGLNGKLQKLSESIMKLDSDCRYSLQKIRNKEEYIKMLSKRMGHSDPTANDIAAIAENLNKMCTITEEMEPSDKIKLLDSLLADSKVIVERLETRFKQEDVSGEISAETLNIKEIKEELEKLEEQKRVLKTERSEIETEYQEAKTASKVAHNRIMNSLKENSDPKLQQRLRDAEKVLLELRDKRSTLNGSLAQIKRQNGRMEEELLSYSKANSLYSEYLGKVVCNKIIISDLEKLKECFTHSIMAFHNKMIAKINEVLRARWRQIYQGSDIDCIELVDEEILKGKDKKTFNYYIAMRKGGIRMKMREKSSAGQRALASIILRMTLAELFVKDFSFIALDEPTANLDIDNVKALTQAIASYVKRRSNKGLNMQWIIITHDETLLRALNLDYSPYYYRIQLDSESCSRINRISYQELPMVEEGEEKKY